MIDWIGNVKFFSGENYVNEAKGVTSIAFRSIPGSDVISHDMPKISIKPSDDFFANDSQEISISFLYNYTADAAGALYKMLFVDNPDPGGYFSQVNKDYHDLVVCLYDRLGNRFFDGVVLISGKSYDYDSGMITLKLSDFMSISKWYYSETSTMATAAVINIKALFTEIMIKSFSPPATAWALTGGCPIQVQFDAQSRRFANFDNYQFYPTPDTFTAPYGVSYINYAGFVVSETKTRLYVTFNYGREIDHDEHIFEYKLIIWQYTISGGTQLQKQEYVYTRQTSDYTKAQIDAQILAFGDANWSGVNHVQGVTNYTKTIITTGGQTNISITAIGGYILEDLRIKAGQKYGDIIKLFLYLMNWKMVLDKNRLKVTNASEFYEESELIVLSHSQVAELTLDVVDKYETPQSSYYGVIDGDSSFYSYSTESYYVNFLPTMAKEFSVKIKPTASQNLKVGSPFTIPAYDNPYSGIKARVFEIEQDQDDTDWYNCKAYNIN
jgi:hypothetical protein